MSKKVTADFYEIVWIEIKGEKRESSGFPKVPDDGGLCNTFSQFCLDNKIYPAIRGGCSGGGVDIHGYWPKDAEVIAKWLKENNVDCTEISQE